MDKMHFTFSDTIAGYVTTTPDSPTGKFGLKTSDGREFQVQLNDATYAEVIRNPSEQYKDPGVSVQPCSPPAVSSSRTAFSTRKAGTTSLRPSISCWSARTEHDWRFESPDWWINQIRDLAEFCFNAQFPDGVIDYQIYRTQVTLEGQKIPVDAAGDRHDLPDGLRFRDCLHDDRRGALP